MSDPTYVDLTLDRALELSDSDAARELLAAMAKRIYSVREEQDLFRQLCDRFDALYYANNVSQFGADIGDPPDPEVPGRSYVSVNTPPVYVDTPASLQAVTPIENMLASDTSPDAREAAAALERIYAAWKVAEDFELKVHKAATVKGLYGRTAGRIYWDDDAEDGPRPCFEVVEQPRNLYLGYRSDAYDKLEWAAYVTRMEPNAVLEEFGVAVDVRSFGEGGSIIIPWVAVDTTPARTWLHYGDARIEVYDYWYREPLYKNGKFVKMETWNVVFAGNAIVRGPSKYPEYDGYLPYVPLFNTFIPGVPNGRSDLYDMEQLIREKMARITSGAQMIASATAGDYWQLVGPEAPTRIDPNLKPKRNTIIGPGAGNRIEPITPFIAQFQLEQFLARIDREMATVSGLNDLLLGLAPAQVLSSSKAINALIANYEAHISMRRKLFYSWRKKTWELALRVYAKKDSKVRAVVKAGGGTLDITDPSLSPKDELETMTRALNGVNGKLISQRTGMDWIGIEDPETEQDLIREESTDATLFPDRVQVMAQLLTILQSLGLQAPAGAQAQAQGQLGTGQADLRAALGGATPAGTVATQGPEVQGMTPPIAGAPPEAGGPPSPFAQGPAATVTSQSMLKGGKSNDRILTQQQLGRR